MAHSTWALADFADFSSTVLRYTTEASSNAGDGNGVDCLSGAALVLGKSAALVLERSALTCSSSRRTEAERAVQQAGRGCPTSLSKITFAFRAPAGKKEIVWLDSDNILLFFFP